MNNINFYRAEKIHHKIHRHAREHIHRVRQKSDTHRKIHAFLISFIITLIVFMLWYFLSLPKILANYEVTKSENQRLGDNPIDKMKNIFNTESIEEGETISNIEIIQ